MSPHLQEGRGARFTEAVAALEARLVFSEECGKAPGGLGGRRVEAAFHDHRKEGPRLRAAVEILAEHDGFKGAARLDGVENKCGAGPVSLAAGRLPRAPAQACAPKVRFLFKERFESYGLPSLVSQRRSIEDEDGDTTTRFGEVDEARPVRGL